MNLINSNIFTLHFSIESYGKFNKLDLLSPTLRFFFGNKTCANDWWVLIYYHLTKRMD